MEWKRIEFAPKFSTEPIYIWGGDGIVEATWGRRYPSDSPSWGVVESDRYGDEFWSFEPQPKYYLAITRPPLE